MSKEELSHPHLSDDDEQHEAAVQLADETGESETAVLRRCKWSVEHMRCEFRMRTECTYGYTVIFTKDGKLLLDPTAARCASQITGLSLVQLQEHWNQIANAICRGGPIKQTKINAAINMWIDLKPEHPADAMYITSAIISFFLATSTISLPLSMKENRFHSEKSFVNLSRLFAQQLEQSEKRRRGSGSQKITVEHVTVEKGGQAIVGTVETGRGRGQEKTLEGPHDESE